MAVIGTGSIGLRHYKALSRIEGVRPVAIPVRPARVQALHEAGYTAVQRLDDAVRLGARFCIIATDSGRHVHDGIEAAGKGLHMLVEKPLSTDSIQARQLCRVVQEASQNIFVGCVLRFSQSLNRFREMLNDVGLVHSVHIECRSYLPDWRPGHSYRESYSARFGEGGVLRDMIHEIDYAGWLFGWPRTVQARVKNLGRLGIEADEVAELTWEAPTGCLVSIGLDYLSKPTRRRMTVYGEHGTLEWDGVTRTVCLHLGSKTLEAAVAQQTQDDMMLDQARAFLDAGAGRYDSRLASAEDGVKALSICDAARRAEASGRAEAVTFS